MKPLKLKTDAEMLLDIKGYKYYEPDLKKNKYRDNAYQNSHVLLKRIIEARESFLELYKQGRFYDANIIAGNILETLSIFSFINNGSNPKHNANLYEASSLFYEIQYNLNIIEVFKSQNMKSQEIIERNLTDLINIFKIKGKLILKPGIDISKHNKIINDLLDPNIKNSVKFGNMKNIYKTISPDFYIDEFIKLCLKINPNEMQEVFNAIYGNYCKIKHTNLFSSDKFSPKEIQKVNGIFAVYLSFQYLDLYGFNKVKIKK